MGGVKLKKFLCVLIMIFTCQLVNAQQLIIPAPVSYVATDQRFELDGELIIHVGANNDVLVAHALRFQQFLLLNNIESNIRQPKMTDFDARILSLQQHEGLLSELGEEGYRLEVKTRSISISAASSAGVFYGLQSLKQLMPLNTGVDQTQKTKRIQIEGCRVEGAAG